MKKEVELRYPHSASLFRFCRKVLDHKYGGIRVIDQDVGQILGFDPADCSHWKKGKKNIRSIQAMKSIADHLGIDERLVVDVASGDLSDHEAYFEYSGYGAFAVDNKIFDSAKKEFYRQHASSWSKEKEFEFKQWFKVDRAAILAKVAEIHEQIQFKEAPLYLPEIVSYYPEIQLKPLEGEQDPLANAALGATWEANKYVISYQSGFDLRPFMRFRIAKSLSSYFLPSRGQQSEDMQPFVKHLLEVESNIFACNLLAPDELVRQEIKQLNVAKDLISQLAETFWVSKIFMNQRLKDMLLYTP